MRFASTLVLLGSIASSSAQFPVIGNGAGFLMGLTSLTNAGSKLIEQYHQNPDTIHILNMDLSLYRSLVVPPLAPGWSQGDAYYVTEALFDNDPVTIEYLAVITDTNGDRWVKVCREDGTVLLSVQANIQGGQGYQGVEPYQHPIISSPINGTYLCVYNSGPPHTTIYQLPGQLPCVDCSGIAMDVPIGSIAPTQGSFNLLPNPAAGEALLTYPPTFVPQGAELVLYDVRGSEVLRLSIDGSGHQRIDLAQLPATSYTCQMIADGRAIGVKRLVVLR